jgi:hypothetical protein
VASSTYPPISAWHVPQAAIDTTLAAVAPAGRTGRESGVFWLGERDTLSIVRALVYLHGAGVTEAVGRWIVSPEAYGVVGRLAREHELTLLGSAHTHGVGVPVALSRTDREHGTRVPEILALVIGNNGADRNPARWSWNTFENHDFRAMDREELHRRLQITDEPVRRWRANATGAQPWNGSGA